MIHRFLAGLALAFLAGPVLASACPAHYVAGRLPEIPKPELATATRELCYGEFGVVHSGVTRTPLWSAEYLSARNLALAAGRPRKNSFHPEPRLPGAERAELRDYARSGYDRGHMSPSANMPNRRAQYESFTLANMVPQDADNNREVWAGIEGTVRKMAKKDGALYVITGPAFIGGTLRRIGNVRVPTHLYKVVYSPKQKGGAAWFVENRGDVEARLMTIAQLEQAIGIDVMPALGPSEKRTLLRVPKARARWKRGSHADQVLAAW
ncbi:MAG TPA: DNA/RNA non-specific endonuclease [Telluria sp.]|nr:DNA/RNA non-specific endonuclease [Telluria sp.]